jgi:hypothetical protein
MNEIARELAACMDVVRTHTYDGAELNSMEKKYGLAMLPALRQCACDPDSEVARQAYGLILRLAGSAKDEATRQRIIELLVADLKDYRTNGTSDFVTRRLLEFSAVDFSDEAKVDLHEMLSAPRDRRYAPIGGIILMAGVADMKSELPHLQAIVDSEREDKKASYQKRIDAIEREIAGFSGVKRGPPVSMVEERKRIQRQTYWQDSILWFVMRARARMGVKEDIQQCIEMAESHPDPNYRAERVFEQLAYVRQPEVVEYLRRYLNSDRPPPFHGYDVVPVSEAERAGSALQQMLENWPVKTYGHLMPQQLREARKWMADQKEWKIIR